MTPATRQALIEVLEVDQWTSTGDIRQHPFDELVAAKDTGAIQGGDAQAARAIFGGILRLRHVDLGRDHCPRGCVWFGRGADGMPELLRSNYDSSD